MSGITGVAILYIFLAAAVKSLEISTWDVRIFPRPVLGKLLLKHQILGHTSSQDLRDQCNHSDKHTFARELGRASVPAACNQQVSISKRRAAGSNHLAASKQQLSSN